MSPDLILVAVGCSFLILILLTIFVSSTRELSLLFFLAVFVVSLVLLTLYILYYSPSSTSVSQDGQPYSVNFHNLDPGLETVNITLPTGENLSLNSGQSIYGVQLYITNTVEAVGLPTYPKYQSANYSESLNFSSPTTLDYYYSTGGPKESSQYITNLDFDNSDIPSPTTIYANDGQNNYYPFITIPPNTFAQTVGWVGQSFSIDLSGENSITLSQSTDTKVTVTSTGLSLS